MKIMVAGSSVTSVDNGYLVKVPLVIMDNKSFEEYCSQIGVTPNLDGAIVLNRIWDNINSNFRYKQYIPFVNESQNVISVQNRDNAEADMYVRILADAELSLEDVNTLEAFVVNIIGNDYVIESENRIQEKVSNDEMKDGFMMIIGAFCVLLATIGIANVFSNTLGFIQLRKREIVQYMSIGMTETSIRKMFSIEALVITGRPLLITLPLTIVFVGLAYYFGGRRILKTDMAETLRNDTLV